MWMTVTRYHLGVGAAAGCARPRDAGPAVPQRIARARTVGTGAPRTPKERGSGRSASPSRRHPGRALHRWRPRRRDARQGVRSPSAARTNSLGEQGLSHERERSPQPAPPAPPQLRSRASRRDANGPIIDCHSSSRARALRAVHWETRIGGTGDDALPFRSSRARDDGVARVDRRWCDDPRAPRETTVPVTSTARHSGRAAASDAGAKIEAAGVRLVFGDLRQHGRDLRHQRHTNEELALLGSDPRASRHRAGGRVTVLGTARRS